MLSNDLAHLKSLAWEKLNQTQYRLCDPIRDREESWNALVAAARAAMPKGYMDAVDLDASKLGFTHTCAEWRLAANLSHHWTIETRWVRSAGHWIQGDYHGQASEEVDGVRGRFRVLRIPTELSPNASECFADLGMALAMAEMTTEDGAPF